MSSEWGLMHCNQKRYRIVKVERYLVTGEPYKYYIVQFRRLRFFWVTATEWKEKPNQSKVSECRFETEEDARLAVKSWRDERYKVKQTVVRYITESDRDIS